VSDSVAYLLGELDPSQTAAFERAMASDARLRGEVERLRGVVGRLEQLPPETWQDVEVPALAMPPAEARSPRRVVLRPRWAVALAVALLALGVGAGAWLDRDPAPAGGLALRPVGSLEPAASGRVTVAGDTARVRMSRLTPTADGQFYELWLLGEDGRLIGLGSFRVGADGKADIDIPLPVDPGAFEYFDISLEPPDGDPGHSGQSVLRGPTV
jgi:anti-sigma-K factor RskA